MTDTIRDLLISLASHMAYMQGHLEARHELDDPEDYYWYRESVLLRRKVTDALADEPTAGEPASVTGQPSDEELNTLWNCSGIADEHGNHTGNIFEFARAVLARWGNPAPQPPAEGEVAELVQLLRHAAEVDGWDGASPEWCQSMLRAAELLQRQYPQPVPVSEGLPRPEDCDAGGRCWVGRAEYDFPMGDTGKYGHADPEWCLEKPPTQREIANSPFVWLPAHALPLPGQEVER